MNQTDKYTKSAPWMFTLAVVAAFVVIYASQTGHAVLLYAGVAASLVLSLLLLLFVLQLNGALEGGKQEIARLERREQDRLLKERNTTGKNGTQTGEFRMDDILARIMPAPDAVFSSTRQYTEKILQNLAKELDIVQGLAFVVPGDDHLFHISGEYAYFSEEQPRNFPLGKTLSGQAAKNQQLLNIQDIPEGYITILSGLGKSAPRHLIIAPVIYDGESIGVIELASFKPFGTREEQVIGKVTELMAGKLNELRI